MDSVPTWGLLVLGAVTAFITVGISKYSTKLFNGKGIKEIVDSANAVIQMYEKHVGALELEVTNLKNQIEKLEGKLDETLKHNEALQKLLLVSPAVTLPQGGVKGE
jgi:peptidoglycan hydrolase CwlO-like protein